MYEGMNMKELWFDAYRSCVSRPNKPVEITVNGSILYLKPWLLKIDVIGFRFRFNTHFKHIDSDLENIRYSNDVAILDLMYNCIVDENGNRNVSNKVHEFIEDALEGDAKLIAEIQMHMFNAYQEEFKWVIYFSGELYPRQKTIATLYIPGQAPIHQTEPDEVKPKIQKPDTYLINSLSATISEDFKHDDLFSRAIEWVPNTPILKARVRAQKLAEKKRKK